MGYGSFMGIKPIVIKGDGCHLEIRADREGVTYCMNVGGSEEYLILKGNGLDLLEDILVKLEDLKAQVRRSKKKDHDQRTL